MKKILTKGKGFLSLFVLVLISVFVISSVTSASLSATGKRQYKASKGYRSQTKVTGAYDDRGLKVGTTMPGLLIISAHWPALAARIRLYMVLVR